MNEGDNIVTHIGKSREMDEQLSSIGERILDTHFVMVLLGSLPESYRTLVVSLGTRPPSELTLTMVIAQLLQQESQDKNTESTSEVTLAVGRKSKPHVHSYNSAGLLIITRRMPNVDIVARKVTMRGNVGPKRRTRSQES